MARVAPSTKKDDDEKRHQEEFATSYCVSWRKEWEEGSVFLPYDLLSDEDKERHCDAAYLWRESLESYVKVAVCTLGLAFPFWCTFVLFAFLPSPGSPHASSTFMGILPLFIDEIIVNYGIVYACAGWDPDKVNKDLLIWFYVRYNLLMFGSHVVLVLSTGNDQSLAIFYALYPLAFSQFMFPILDIVALWTHPAAGIWKALSAKRWLNNPICFRAFKQNLMGGVCMLNGVILPVAFVVLDSQVLAPAAAEDGTGGFIMSFVRMAANLSVRKSCSVLCGVAGRLVDTSKGRVYGPTIVYFIVGLMNVRTAINCSSHFEALLFFATDWLDFGFRSLKTIERFEYSKSAFVKPLRVFLRWGAPGPPPSYKGRTSDETLVNLSYAQRLFLFQAKNIAASTAYVAIAAAYPFIRYLPSETVVYDDMFPNGDRSFHYLVIFLLNDLVQDFTSHIYISTRQGVSLKPLHSSRSFGLMFRYLLIIAWVPALLDWFAWGMDAVNTLDDDGASNGTAS